MRLFVALLLTGEMKDALCQAQAKLKALARSGNFSRRENLHLTLAFLGECPPSAVHRIRRAMTAAAEAAGPFPMTLDRLGRFRRPGADLWWAGVKRQETLRPGEIGIFLYNGEGFCKRLDMDGRSPVLTSLNRQYSPIRVKEGDEFRVFGRVVG